MDLGCPFGVVRGGARARRRSGGWTLDEFDRAPVADIQALQSVLDRLDQDMDALDIGCGAGLPVC